MISTKNNHSKFFNLVLYVIFSIVGIGCGYPLTFKPIKELISASNWDAIPCEVVSSKIIEGRSSGRTRTAIYRPEIKYQYWFNGQIFQNSQFHVLDFSSCGYQGKQQIVSQYPVGFKFTCFVNPRDPQQSFIDKSPGGYLFITLLPLPLLGIGLVGLYFTLRKPA